jgi:hypothetical protein
MSSELSRNENLTVWDKIKRDPVPALGKLKHFAFLVAFYLIDLINNSMFERHCDPARRCGLLGLELLPQGLHFQAVRLHHSDESGRAERRHWRAHLRRRLEHVQVDHEQRQDAARDRHELLAVSSREQKHRFRQALEMNRTLVFFVFVCFSISLLNLKKNV